MAKGLDGTHHELVCQAVFNNERFLYMAKLRICDLPRTCTTEAVFYRSLELLKRNLSYRIINKGYHKVGKEICS